MAATPQAVTTRTVAQKRPQSLALLYQECITALVRVRAGEVRVDNASFRMRAKRAIEDAEKRAAELQFDRADIRKASLAVVGLLDEVALGSGAFDRTDWHRLPLALEMYEEPRAGQVVFSQLEDSLAAGAGTLKHAQLLEVYMICLLLGFEGRYSGRPDELRAIIDRLRGRISEIKPWGGPLCPEVEVQNEAEPPAPAPAAKPKLDRLLLLGIIAGGGAILLFLLFKLHLWWASGSAAEVIRRS